MSHSPYAGLRPFKREETDIFFGREEHTDELLSHLSQQHFLAVIGMSGCGKSSLVKTGLIPNLEAGFLNAAGTHWRIAEMRPGHQPFKNLAEALINTQALGASYQTAIEKNEFLKRGAFSLHELLAIQPLPNQAKLLIVCDQFEEIFRYYEQGAKIEAEAFVSLLLASSKPFNLPDHSISHDIYIVLTMRSDFLGDCALFTGLAEAINNGLYLTPRLNREQLRMAIEEPAFIFGGEVAPECVVKLLEDAGNNQDQLPLLQHALLVMWQLMEKADERRITLQNYEQIGRLDNALSAHADKTFTKLSLEQQRIAEIMFRGLTERGDAQRDTRRPMKLVDIAALAGVNWQDVAAIVEVFRQTGRCFLMPPIEIVLTPDSVIDISHESLIRQWQRLKTWTEDEAENAKTYQRLEDRAMEWQHQKTSLLQSPELEVYQQWWQEKNPTELWVKRYGEQFVLTKEFLNTSQKVYHQEQQNKNKQWRLLIISLISFSILVSSLAFWAWQEKQQAKQQTILALQAIDSLTYDLIDDLIKRPSTLPAIEKIIYSNINSSDSF